MTLVCRNCQRVNPQDALYCYFDGRALVNGAVSHGPVSSGTQPFMAPFVFPSGRPCRNFDEMVIAAQELWPEAQELLREGYFAVFLGGIGRADLARAARKAKDSPDPDRALDDFLGQLPSTARDPASLHVQPREIHLGQLTRKDNRRFVLRLENQGMCLLHGSVASDDTPWLVLGDPPGVPQKLFECRHDVSIPVQVVADRLRAGHKPLEGRLLIESNGGTETVVVRAEVPAQPFPEGILAGATTPRQLAEKAKASPKPAVPLFEKGAVAAWYAANGWVYPIQGPQALGLGAIQQFFEALGLTTPPRIEISELFVKLHGSVGARLEYFLKATAVENRPVFAHATSTVPWLRVAQVIPEGRTARIRLEVPSVPDAPGEALLGKVQVSANGNQRFTVAVSLSVTPGAGSGRRPSAAPVVLNAAAIQAVAPPLPVGRSPAPEPVPFNPEILAPAPLLTPEVVHPGRPASVPAPLPAPIAIVSSPPARELAERPWMPALIGEAPTLLPGPLPGPLPTPARVPAGGPAPRRPSPPIWLHLVPLGIILLLLLGVVAHDASLDEEKKQTEQAQPEAEEVIDLNPYVELHVHNRVLKPDVFREPTLRFGLLMPRAKDPTDPRKKKKLTFDEWGRSNNTCLRIDGKEVLFADAEGTWVERYKRLGKDKKTQRDLDGFDSVWKFRDVEVAQHVEVIPGRQSRALDTCLVHYTLTNKATEARRVGLRFLLDTYIGANDGVPFTIPGQRGLCSTLQAFTAPADVPDFIEALEKDDLSKPGTVARLQFRLGKRLDAPDRVLLGGWPHPSLRFRYPLARGERTLWEVPRISMTMDELRQRVQQLEDQGRAKRGSTRLVKPDSAVTMYWDEKPLPPGGRREIAFTYGLAKVVSGGRLLLTVGGQFIPDGEITLTALVRDPEGGEKLTLKLPPGLDLLPGNQAEQAVPAVPPGSARNTSTVTWRLKAGALGKHTLEVISSAKVAQKQPIVIYPVKKGSGPGVFD